MGLTPAPASLQPTKIGDDALLKYRNALRNAEPRTGAAGITYCTSFLALLTPIDHRRFQLEYSILNSRSLEVLKFEHAGLRSIDANEPLSKACKAFGRILTPKLHDLEAIQYPVYTIKVNKTV